MVKQGRTKGYSKLYTKETRLGELILCVVCCLYVFRAILDDMGCVIWNRVEFCCISRNFQKPRGGH